MEQLASEDTRHCTNKRLRRPVRSRARKGLRFCSAIYPRKTGSMGLLKNQKDTHAGIPKIGTVWYCMSPGTRNTTNPTVT